MKALITSGGTAEEIDSVRSITNHSTGRLGSIIADTFVKGGAQVTYVCAENAALPAAEVNLVKIKTVQQLIAALEDLLETQKFDCIIHAMAVSDFTMEAVLTEDLQPISESKISSKHEKIMLLLKRTPKVIEMFKGKGAKLVGFKLLSDVSETELLRVASALLERNACDYVLANDKRGIHGSTHKALLLSADGTVLRASTKQEIANLIYERVTR